MSTGAPAEMDPIALEIVTNALRSVTDETYIALMRSAYSTNIKERHDHSTGLVDAQGRLVAQADSSLPIHLSSMIGLMEKLLAKYQLDDIHEGDIFVANDPYVAGGTHLPDINMVMPVFVEGRLLGFMCNLAHHADVGGMVPGSMAGGMSEIYQEGLRIPLIKLFRRGRLQQDLLDLLLLNVRVPEERRGDYFAQVAACRLGERRLQEIARRYSFDFLIAAFDEIISRTQTRMRAGIATIPDGTYTFDDVMDDDGLGTVDIPIKIRIDVEGDRIKFDFTGTSAQVRGNINTTLYSVLASVGYTLKAMLDPEAPNNHGMINVCEVIAEKGSLVDCVFPAPLAARAHTCQRIIDVTIGALAKALPQAAVGAANGANTTVVFAGVDPRTGSGYVYLETLGGGFGGRNDRDGKDGVQVHITNTSNLPVEAIEMEYPLRVVSYGLIPDSGGAGEYRGGLGLRRAVQPVGHDCLFNGAGERFRHRPWGLFGAGPGASGRFVHVDTAGHERTLDVKPLGLTVKPGETIVVETPGAGGYGAPGRRSAPSLAQDRDSGKFSQAWLARHYGAEAKRRG